MSNIATYAPVPGAPVYAVMVNGYNIYYTNDSSVASTITNRLNTLFSDTNRDLDFITPSIVNGNYVVCCPKVRKNVGQVTYLYDTDGSNGWRQYGEKLYEATNWSSSSTPSEQTAILTITDSSTPWYSALLVANKIRDAVNLNFNDAYGSSECRTLYVPSNTYNTVNTVISSSAICDFYGVPCQGTQPGKTSSCTEIGYSAENILNVNTASYTGNEVFHPQDLTAAITTTNNWYSNYKGKYVKVTNRSNNKSVVVKITDAAPANRGIELAYRPWVEIGKPSGAGTVKIELMN